MGTIRSHEPGDTEIGQQLRRIVLDPATGPMSDRTETLLYAATQEDAAAAPTVQAQPSDVELAPDTDGTWTIGPRSSAGYRVDEVLNGADVTVAGTTDQVTGSVVVEGGDLATAEVVVDVASTRTDVGQRDAYFRDDVMEVGTWPTGTFGCSADGYWLGRLYSAAYCGVPLTPAVGWSLCDGMM